MRKKLTLKFEKEYEKYLWALHDQKKYLKNYDVENFVRDIKLEYDSIDYSEESEDEGYEQNLIFQQLSILSTPSAMSPISFVDVESKDKPITKIKPIILPKEEDFVVLSDDENDENDFNLSNIRRNNSLTQLSPLTIHFPNSPKTPKTKPKLKPIKARSPKTMMNIKVSTAKKEFQKQKERMTKKLYKKFNENIFSSLLPHDMEVTWSATLNKTAGRTWLKSRGTTRFATIELASKVVDSEYRLRNTLVHEMCHAAAWIVNNSSNPPHGEYFKRWGKLAAQKYCDLEVTTCHSYQINFKHNWECLKCHKKIGRHSNSVNLDVSLCICGGALKKLSKLNKDGTPSKPRTPSVFSKFIKDNYSSVKQKTPNSKHGEVMKILSEQYRLQKI